MCLWFYLPVKSTGPGADILSQRYKTTFRCNWSTSMNHFSEQYIKNWICRSKQNTGTNYIYPSNLCREDQSHSTSKFTSSHRNNSRQTYLIAVPDTWPTIYYRLSRYGIYILNFLYVYKHIFFLSFASSSVNVLYLREACIPVICFYLNRQHKIYQYSIISMFLFKVKLEVSAYESLYQFLSRIRRICCIRRSLPQWQCILK